MNSWIERFNAAGLSDDERHALLVDRFASVGAGAIIRPPFFCDDGHNISIGEGAFLNFNCVILDVEPV
jgi:maltose O-acetyltransferase